MALPDKPWWETEANQQMTNAQKEKFITTRSGPTQIEMTSKKLKLWDGIATAVCIVALVLLIVCVFNETNLALRYFLAGTFIISLISAIVMRVIIWWHHG